MERFVTAAEVNPVLVRELSWSDRLQRMVGPFYVEVANIRIRVKDMTGVNLQPGETGKIPGLSDSTVITLSESQCQMIANVLNNTYEVEELRAQGIDAEAIPRFNDEDMTGVSLGFAWDANIDYPCLKRVVYLPEY